MPQPGRHRWLSRLITTGASSALVLSISAGIVPVALGHASAATPPAPNAGSLDSSWGNNGVATVSIPGESSLTAANRILPLSDGSAFVAGVQAGLAGSAFVAKLTPSGALDSTFGNAGVAKPGIGSGVAGDSVSIARQASNGDILIAGSAMSGKSQALAIARLTPSGTMDTTFGTNGLVTTPTATETVVGAYSIGVSATGAINVIPKESDSGDGLAVMQYTSTGALDSSFGTSGFNEVSSNLPPSALRDMAYTADGHIVGVGLGTKSGTTTLVARFTANGQPDTSFPNGSGTGVEAVDVSGNGTSNQANAVAVDGSGNLLVAGTISTSPTTAYVMRLTPAGARDSSFGSNGVISGSFDTAAGTGNAIAVDHAGRYLASGGAGASSTSLTGLGVERLTSGSNPYDTGFGVTASPGRESVGCSSSTAGASTAVAEATSQKILVAGTCNGSVTVARLNAGNLSNLAMTASSPTIQAGHGTLPLSSIPNSALLSVNGGIVGTPVTGHPVTGHPVTGHPVTGHPVTGHGGPGDGTPGYGAIGFDQPVLQSPLTDPILGPIPLSSVPLYTSPTPGTPTTWQDVIAGTAYDGLPLQSITLQQVLAISPAPAALNALTLGQLDVTATPLRKASVGAIMLGTTPISALPSPCSFITGQPDNCQNNGSIQSQSLMDLEISGDSLQSYYSNASINLVGLALVNAPVLFTRLDNIDMSLTSLGQTLTTALHTPATFLTCTPSATSTTCDTLLDAEIAGNLQTNAAANLGALLADSPSAVGQLPFTNLVVAALPREDFPIESVNPGQPAVNPNAPAAAAIIANSPMPATGAGYQVTFNMGCGVANTLVVTPSLPTDFRIIPSTATMAVGPSGSQTSIPVTVSNGSIRPAGTVNCTGFQPVTINFQAEPSTILGGPLTSGVTASVSSDSLSISNQAPVTVVKNFAPNSPTSPIPAVANTVYVGHIATAGDTDYYSLPAPVAGSTVSVSLSHLPQDYDLVVYGPGVPLLRSAPGLYGDPVTGHPVTGHPTAGSPGESSPGYGSAGFTNSVNDPNSTFDNSGSTARPTLDPDVPRLDMPIRGFSDNRGTADESTQITVSGTDASPFLIQVTGYNGASSNLPYVLRVTVTPPPLALPCSPLPFDPTKGTVGALPSTPLASSTQTLILVNEKRLGAIYGNVNLPDGTSGDAGQVIVSHLQSLAQQSSVQGVVVPVEGDSTVAQAYTNWDANPCSVDGANQVVTAINALVDRLRSGLTNLKNIVVIGNDSVIPFARVTDYAALFNESQFSEDSFNGFDNPESAAARQGYVLSDNPYGDLAPTAYLGGALYVPQLAVGRLVETPGDIAGQINSYIAAGGVTSPAKSFVTAYSPFDASGTLVNTALTATVGTTNATSQINETWTRQDAINGLNSAANGYASVNAHYDFYRALTAAEFTNGTQNNLLSTADLPASLQGGVEFTIGCHAGTSVPDIYIANPTQAQQAMLLDWPQAEMHNGAAGYAANTGYGLGDSSAVAYSDKLNVLFAQNLGPSMTIGQALSFAKQSYLAGVGIATVYDAKALEEDTFYGLPMWRVGANGQSASVALPPPPPASGTPTSLATTTQDVQPVFSTPTPAPSRGNYYLADGHTPLAVPNEPIEPITTRTLPIRTDGLVAHGAILEHLTSQDVAGFKPVYSTPDADNASLSPEPPVANSDFPSQLQSVAGSVTPSGRQDTLSLVAGQFFSDSSGTGTGTQRLFSDINSSVLYSNSNDFTAPRLSNVVATVQGSVAQFTVTTPDSNVVRGVVLMLLPGLNAGSGTQNWVHVELVNTGNGVWVGTTTLPSGTTAVGQYFAQLANSNGNVGVSSNKGLDYSAGSIAGFQVSVTPPPNPANGLYPGPTESVTLTPPAGTTATYTLDGGSPTNYTGPISISGQGGHVLVATASNGVTATYGFPIDTSPPAITVTAPTNGTSYQRGSTVTPSFSCSSAVGTVSCQGPPTVDTSTPGTHTYTVTSTDFYGVSSSSTVTYTVTENAPTVTITSGPSQTTATTSTSATFTYTSTDPYGDPLTTTCSLDGSQLPASQCGSSSATVTGVQPRQTPHTFNVTVTDPFGSSGSASWSWTVYAPPTVAITSGPAEGSITDSTSAAFTYTSSSPVGLQLTTTCTSDGTVTQCGSSSAMVTGLQPSAAMEHSFVVTVTDSTGGHASASRNWFVYYDTVTTPAPVAFGVPLSATLTAPTQTPTTAVANQVIKFIAGQNNPNGTVICTATTNSSGKATCGTLEPTVTALGAGGVTAVFSGNPPYLPSQGSAGLA